MPNHSDIISLARSFLGTPFHHQGRLPGIGLDCVGLIVCIADRLGFPHKDFRSYSRHPDGVTLEREISKSMDRIPVATAIPGDVVIFRVGRYPRHVGVLTDKGIVHTYDKAGKVVEHGLDARWKDLIVGAYRYRGVDGWQQ